MPLAVFKKDRCVQIHQSLAQSHPSLATAMGTASSSEKGCKSPDGGQGSCRTDKNLGFNEKNKQKEKLISWNASICLPCSVKQQAGTPFLFSFLVWVEVPAGETAGGESMACVMLAGRLHRS